jgi:amidase
MNRHVHTFTDDALADHDAVALAELLRARKLSPHEVADAALRRLESVGDVLNATAHIASDHTPTAGPGTDNADRDGFAGVPTFVKDNVEAEGMPTLCGTDAWNPAPAPADSPFTRVYRRTGLTILGKTTMSEFGFNVTAEHPRLGAVRNPWNTDYTAGASSAGSAALVAAGVVPIAHGNDGGGSIRIPASCTGLVGLKPSRGRLPLDATMGRMPIRILTNGVLTRTVRDTAAFYREAERIWVNPKLPPIGNIHHPCARRLNIAVCTNSVHTSASPEIRELTVATASLLESLGHRVTEIDTLPAQASLAEDFLLYWAMLAMMLSRGGRVMFGPSYDRRKLDTLTLGLADHFRRSLPRLPAALARLATARRHTTRFYRDYDLLLTPTTADVTPRIGYLAPTGDLTRLLDRLVDWVAFTPLQNVTGEPAISLPLGRSADGMPVGMMLSAAHGNDASLLEIGYELERAHPQHLIDDPARKPPTAVPADHPSPEAPR